MNEKERESEPPTEGHHRSARERQRRGPMWGCLKALLLVAAGVFILFLIVAGGGWWYAGTASFADVIRTRVQETLKTRLDRNVTIGSIRIDRTHGHVFLDDLRIANPPGALHPWFVTIREVEITGRVDSFWNRKIRVSGIDIRDPQIDVEIYPTGSPLVHNVPHWQSGPPSKYEIVHLDLGKLNLSGGGLNFIDRKHDIGAVLSDLTSSMTVTGSEDLYEGVMTSPRMRVRIQDYVPFDVDMRGGFRFTPGVLELKSVAMTGPAMKVYVSGKLDPLADGVYNLHVVSQIGLNRVREIFRVNKVLDGQISVDGMLRGRQGDFTLTGGWVSPKIKADVYELSAVRGRMKVTGERAEADVDSARYGGGAITAHYHLPRYVEPYPMSVELHYDHISAEKLFQDWDIKDTGLRGAATGDLTYHWEKDRILAGAGNGLATLSRNSEAFSHATYPVPLAGSTEFSLNNGTLTFKKLDLDTGMTHLTAAGTLRIEDALTNLEMKIQSSDFAELDRIGYNFARSAGKSSYTLLGLGGSGDISGTVQGKLKTADVVAHITGTGTKYNNILLGNSDLDIRYAGIPGILTFQKADFRDEHGKLALTGTVGFPNSGPSPTFDIAIDATNYPVESATSAVALKLAIQGLGTGKLLVTGTPDAGKSRFLGLTVTRGASELKLHGDIDWRPGKGNVDFNLDLAMNAFPVAEIATFLELGTLPASGDVTGTLHLEGPKTKLEGAGAVTLNHGVIAGEPVDLAAADLAFTQGKLRVTNVKVTAPAGEITGEGELNLTTNEFSYQLKKTTLDLSKLKSLSTLSAMLGGKITISSTGGGTTEQPELVAEATMDASTLKGLNLPPGVQPSLYLAIRSGKLIIRGSLGDLIAIDGEGTFGPDSAVDGNVRITIKDIAKVLAMSPTTSTLPASGRATIDLKLGGKLSSIDALTIDGSVPVLDLRVSEHEFKAAEPLRFGLRNGRLTFDSFNLQRGDSQVSVTGYADLTGEKKLDVSVNGSLEAALLQLFVPGMHSEGHIGVAIELLGTVASPRISGTAEFQDAELKFPGFPQMIDHLTGTLVFNGDRIEINALHATVGSGTIVAGGLVTVDGMTPKRARITLQGTDVAIRYFEGMTVEANFNLLISGDTDRSVVQGEVNVNRALYFKEFDFRTSLLNVILSRRGLAPVVAASWQDRVDLRLHLLAPGTLAVKNNLADVTGSADLEVTGTLANPSVLGDITLNEGGKVRFQNIDYRVVRGTINFQNPFRIDPYFDVTVEGRVSGSLSEVESGPLDLTVNITGTLDRITPTITSDPPASDITLFTLLGVGGITGRNSPGGQTPDSSQVGKSLLFQGVGGLLGSSLLSFADSFSIDPGLLETNGPSGPKVTFEKRISSEVRVIVVYFTTAHQSREVIEWAVTPDYTLQFTRDEPKKEFRIEARARRRYDGQWSWRNSSKDHDLFASMGTVSGALAPAASAPTPPTTPIPDAHPFDGKPVKELFFRADGPFDTSNLGQIAPIKAGDTLSSKAVQNAIKSLYGTGDFRDIRADVADTTGGVTLTFVLYRNSRVATIAFDGIHGNDRKHAERELKLHTGDVLSLNAVDRSATDIASFLERDGYLEATVDPETTFDRQRGRAAVIFHVTTGSRAKISTVSIEGNIAPFDTKALSAQMKHGAGRFYRLADAREDAENMQRFLLRRDYRKAEVKYLGETYDAATKTVALRYSARSGPIVKVAVEGVTTRDVRKIIPFKKNQEYSEDIIDKAANDITMLYQQRGYYSASVDTEESLDPKTNIWTTTFHVAPGQQYRLALVTFSGNQKVPEKKLANVIATAPSGGFRSLIASIMRRPSGVTQAQLSADRDALESYYRLEGFYEVKIGTPVPGLRADGTMTVDFPIVEGPQTLVSSVGIEGVEQVKPKELPGLQLKKGKPLNPQLEREDVVALQSFFAERGNAEAQITPRTAVAPDKGTAAVTYVVAEGPKVAIGDVVVRGNTYTNSSLIARKSGLAEGSPFSYSSILEAQRNLYRLGIFQRVDVQPEDAGTSTLARNVSIAVEEGKNLTVSGSAGFSIGSTPDNRFSPRGSISMAHRNLFGTGRYLGLELIGARDDKEAFLTYREPFLGHLNIPVQLTIFQTNDSRRKETHIRQLGTFIEATRPAGNRTQWSIRYEYKVSECIQGEVCDLLKDNIPQPGLDKSLSNIKISSITPTFFWDHRDDTLNPRTGFYTSASVEYAFPLARSKTQFLKEFVQGSWYIPVTAQSVLALSGRAGLIQPGSVGCEDPLPGQPPASNCKSVIPLSERFTAGGDTSHRAFPLDLLGTTCAGLTNCNPTLLFIRDVTNPKDRGRLAPLGGNGMLIFNAEYRFPLVSSLAGALFTDVGNIYAKDIRFGDLRVGVGTGIRYMSPVGPLRFDIGYNVRRDIVGYDGNGAPVRERTFGFFVTLGNPF